MNELEKLHREIFSIDPVVIGLHWSDIEDRLIQAIESGIPYNEERELSQGELAAYKEGKLSF